MTVSEYIKQTFADFGVKLSEAAAIGIVRRSGLDASADVANVEFRVLDVAVVKSIPILLLTPSSVSEGPLSISKAQKESIVQYYSLRCKELGIINELEKRPTVRFL